MANSITSSMPRVSSVSVPVTKDVDGPDEVAKPADTGYAKSNKFDAAKAKLGTAKDLYSTSTSLASGVTSLVGSLTGDDELRGDARNDSIGLLQQAVGAAKDTHSLVGTTAHLLRGEDAKKAVEDRTKHVGKALNMAENAAGVLDPNADMVKRAKSAVSLATDAKDYLKLGEKAGEKVTTGLTAAGKFLGAAGGVMSIARGSEQIATNFKKAASGDVKAGLDALQGTVNVANGAINVVKDAATGIKTLGMAEEAAGKVLGIVAKAGPLAKRLPLVGAGIGTAKAAYDFYKEPSLMNGAKVAANAIGFIPGAGSVVSMIATTALDHPEMVKKAYNTAVDVASKGIEVAANAGAKVANAAVNAGHAMANAGAKAWSFLTGG